MQPRLHQRFLLAARRGVDPVQAARITGHSLAVGTRHYAGDYGKPQRDEARIRMLEAGFGAVPSCTRVRVDVYEPGAALSSDDVEASREIAGTARHLRRVLTGRPPSHNGA